MGSEHCPKCGEPYTDEVTVGIGGSINHRKAKQARTCFQPDLNDGNDPVVNIYYHLPADVNVDAEAVPGGLSP